MYVDFQPAKESELSVVLAGMLIPSTANNLTLIVSDITNDFKISSLLSTTGFNLIEFVLIVLIVVSSFTSNTILTAANKASNSARELTVPSAL